MNATNNLNALRRLPRPPGVHPCADCAAVIGTNYFTCPTCYLVIENHWLADWRAFLAQEQVQSGSDEEQMMAEVVLTALHGANQSGTHCRSG